ncbi:hypothetical protein GCM10010404_61290 [Nonomuraea africana]|uniref:Uncharacterized protein n=1 Tax=Nonomuraea africana TaxID=46171 RepID=A0ABR9K7U0_9ACTN|nr:hypothetical protein [Nonomuraea africana]MBE1557637.1 hypothetical protein [Nonomuraea africana]
MVTRSIEWDDTRAATEQAERMAIQNERPLWNINLSQWRAVRADDGTFVLARKPPNKTSWPAALAGAAFGEFGLRLVEEGDVFRGVGTGDSTKPRQCRVPGDAWTAYERVFARLGTTRAEDLNAHIRQQIREHGPFFAARALRAASRASGLSRARSWSGGT